MQSRVFESYGCIRTKTQSRYITKKRHTEHNHMKTHIHNVAGLSRSSGAKPFYYQYIILSEQTINSVKMGIIQSIKYSRKVLL